MKDFVQISVEKAVIPTYPEPAAEEYPMFAENRVHQRSSGDPYPNKVVMKVDRTHREEKEYTLVRLENAYIRVEILPEIGGRVYSALDKTTGYDFFYKQHVIKPALIGVLGSWISGGIEFNWPFHHRASGFMPCDFVTEQLPDGSAACWLSEHEPTDRMKGMVGIILRPDAAYFETRMRLYNRTDTAHSFLWWENAAVPVNEQYQIFFPQDVTYVNFHYLKSRTTFPIAGNDVYNGIPMDTDRDISWHKNTRQATSYFASASDYDFFGGYDHGKQCGVVHIGDHHISPGKKMFTWAYCQLAKSWENALTDTDGQYAELMAGSYSDNQPNFSWLEPYETKKFSQYWYPITQIGTPTFANLNVAFKLDRAQNAFRIQSTKRFENAEITLRNGAQTVCAYTCTLLPGQCTEFSLPEVPPYLTVSIRCGETLAEYTEQAFDAYQMPEPIDDMPNAAQMNDAQALYLAGVHVAQYRDPAVHPDAYWKKALERDIDHIPSLIAMAKYALSHYDFADAEGYIRRAIRNLQRFNERTQSGEAYYVYGQILEAEGNFDRAYDYYRKAAWAADAVAKAMTRAAMLDIRRKQYAEALADAETALDYGRGNSLAVAVSVIALQALGQTAEAQALLARQLAADPLDHFARFLAQTPDFYARMESDPVQTCLDIAADLMAMGRYADAAKLFDGLPEEKRNKIAWYTLGFAKRRCGADGLAEFEAAQSAPIGRTFPNRKEEMQILTEVVAETQENDAKMLLGCLHYHHMRYEKAAALWSECTDVRSERNLAVACFSHLGRPAEALQRMQKLLQAHPQDEELLYETVVLMDKTGAAPQKKIALILAHPFTRDDVYTELAKAYNQAFLPEKALETLLSHDFVPCEGGEHAIAEQYLFAYLVKGKKALDSGDPETAHRLFAQGQILPQSLGSGIWNRCKLIPLRYHEALCLEKLNRTAEAAEIFRDIAGVKIDYFSNMHLKELPVYQALSLRHLGEALKARHLITQFMPQWQAIFGVQDNGFFATTPFFIPFVDDAKKLRKAHGLYLNALLESAADRPEAEAHMAESASLNAENLYALYFSRFGFLQ